VWVTIFALTSGIYFPVPFLGLFSFGFLYVGGMSLLQTRFGRIRSWAPEIAPEAAAD
jgi:hypothetical protein